MVDNKTQHLGLPLPDLSNMQDEDVPRIGQALRLIDAHVQSVDAQAQAAEAALKEHDVKLQKLGGIAQTDSARIDQLLEDQKQESKNRADADREAAGLIDTLAEAQQTVEQRVEDVERQNAQQDTRLTAVEDVTNQQSTDIAANAAALGGKADTNLGNVPINAIGNYFHARDEKPTGTDGGTSASAAWQTRDLNTVVKPMPWASLSANKVTLQAGRYYIRGATPAMAPFTARAAIYDVTHGKYLLYGPTIYGNTYDGTYPEPVEDNITLSAVTTIELRQYTGQSVAGYGLGRAGTSGIKEVYSELRIWIL